MYFSCIVSRRSGSADSATGVGIEFTVYCMCIIRSSLKGEKVPCGKTAVFVLGVLANGIADNPEHIHSIAKGIIMLSSLWLTNKNSKVINDVINIARYLIKI